LSPSTLTCSKSQCSSMPASRPRGRVTSPHGWVGRAAQDEVRGLAPALPPGSRQLPPRLHSRAGACSTSRRWVS
jgi:hypothetical protein